MDSMGRTLLMFGNIYKNKKVLITGNTGFKGSWLTIWLLKLGAKVFGLSNDIPTKPSMFEELGLKNKISQFEEDVRDLSSVKRIIEEIKPDFVFHLAAQSLVSVSYLNPIKTITTGEGGAILTKDKKIYNKAKLLSNHGIQRNINNKIKWLYDQKYLDIILDCLIFQPH